MVGPGHLQLAGRLAVAGLLHAVVGHHADLGERDGGAGRAEQQPARVAA